MDWKAGIIVITQYEYLSKDITVAGNAHRAVAESPIALLWSTSVVTAVDVRTSQKRRTEWDKSNNPPKWYISFLPSCFYFKSISSLNNLKGTALRSLWGSDPVAGFPIARRFYHCGTGAWMSYTLMYLLLWI